MGKKFVLLLAILIVVLGVLLVEPCVAPVTMSANPSPAPEVVSVEIYHSPIWRPPVYSTNSYTGEVTVVSSGYWKPNGTIEITIKNRPFTAYTDKNGNYINVYYTFFTRAPHLGIPWDIITNPKYAVYQSNVDYTVLTLNYNDSFNHGPDFISFGGEGATREFRVQAVTGYFHGVPPFIDAVFEGEGSEWTEFAIKMPVTDKPGSGPTTTVTTVPLTPGGSSTLSPYTPPSHGVLRQISSQLFVFVCAIVLLFAVIVYLMYRQRKARCVGVVVGDVGCEVKPDE